MDLLKLDYARHYKVLLEPFRNDAFGPELATALLVVAAIILAVFLASAIPKAIRLRSALSTIKVGKATETEQERRANFQANYKQIDSTLSTNKGVSIVWQEFRKTLIPRTAGQRTLIFATTRPQEFFNTRNLRVQYDFVRSLPNFFVGLGLLGTFIGLIAALTFATQDLAVADDQAKIKAALSGLLTTAAAKFYISAAGLIASLILSLSIKTVLKYLHDEIQRINASIEERLLFLTDQNLAERRLAVQQDSLQELKLFNSNIAMKIGDAVRNAIQTSNDSIAGKLERIADTFAGLVGSSGEGASRVVGDAMKSALEGTLLNASTAIGEVARNLETLPHQLGEAANAIRSSGEAATAQQREVANALQQSLRDMLQTAGAQFASGLRDGTTEATSELKVTSTSFGASADKLGVFLNEFTNNGQSYLEAATAINLSMGPLRG
jgi:hypothetical protein